MDLREQLEAALGELYSIEPELGGGGMSRVFLAEETALGRRVVVKVLPKELTGGVNVDRFRREIVLAAQLQHPHIVTLLSTGQVAGVPVLHDAVRGRPVAARAPARAAARCRSPRRSACSATSRRRWRSRTSAA